MLFEHEVCVAHASSLSAALRGGGPDRPEARSGLVGDYLKGRCEPLFIILVEQLYSALRVSRRSPTLNYRRDELPPRHNVPRQGRLAVARSAP